jgi:fused signal recognition particle receptor
MNWFSRLKAGLAKSSAKLGDGITGIFKGGRKLDAASIGDLEELLIQSDLGPATAAKLAGALTKRRFEREVDGDAIREALAEEIAAILAPVAKPLALDTSRKPHVVLVVGVNGSGKTTTIGKMAQQLHGEGKRVTLAAGDTFRAAAIDQLKIWGERTGCPVVAKQAGADAAGLAFEALEQSRARGDDALLVDTAGRLQNKTELMAELTKIVRVLKKVDPTAPHTVLLVLDANIGQNAHQQVEVFRAVAQVTGLAVTKLDGTAKGGVVVALAERFGLPVHAIGVGEGADDLRPFDAKDFARSLVGLG